MRWGRTFAAVFLAVSPVFAQNAPGPPGPYVVDVRGATVALPEGTPFLPPVPSTALVPSRGFGVDAGGHVYFATWKQARVGAGASILVARGTAPDVFTTLRVLAPQVSLNFGTANGWSYLSAGIGGAHLESRRVTPSAASSSTTTATTTTTTTATSTVDGTPVRLNVRALNFGGGARWFVSSHMAVGFDIRMHKLAGGATKPSGTATPGAMLVAASAGLSFR